MRKPVNVYLCGSENNKWALDTDLALTRESLTKIQDVVTLSSFEDADVVHSVWETPLLFMDQNDLVGKRVVCHVCNDFMRLHENPEMIRARETVGIWIAMSKNAEADLQALEYPNVHIPYSVDKDIFRAHVIEDESQQELRRKYAIPEGVFIISNFMRDSFGHDLGLPKDQKGVELLLEIGCCLKETGIPVHFLLAGPRRHWIREHLQRSGIGYTFVGQVVQHDDIAVNVLDSDVIAELYRVSDVHLITSRWEGGPRSVLEAAATKTPILSTPVGIAPDILDQKSLYGALDDAVDKLTMHYEAGWLKDTLDPQYERISRSHTADANADLFRKFYQDIEAVKPFQVSQNWLENLTPPKNSLYQKINSLARKVTGRKTKPDRLCISLWHKFHKPPYGGGNQFMMALQGAMEKQGIKVVTNKLSASVDIHICNSCWFDAEKFKKRGRDYPIRMIHRIDGPVTLYRDEGRSEDARIFSLNSQFASATVFQSAYCFRKSYELGFRAVSPVIISNSVNRDIFYQDGFTDISGRKIRLISTAWSDNPRKGGAFLKWLDGNLDWDRFEYTFVGRVKETFDNINHIQAVPSEELAEILRQHDIFVSVSHHEPCSNALIEALSCGLPALYRNDGGNPELVSFGGLPFTGEGDVLVQLDRLIKRHRYFQNLIQLRTIDDIAGRYIDLAERLCAWKA